MKNLILIVLCYLTYSFCNAQNVSNIAIHPVIAASSEFPQQVQTSLMNKMMQVCTKHGVGGLSLDNRFIMLANCVKTDSHVSPSVPTIYSIDLDISFYIGNSKDGALFSTFTIHSKGIGNNEMKAYSAAIKNVNPNSPSFANFINEGKDKIISYYNSQMSEIIASANSLAAQGNYDEAIATLMAVPEACEANFKKAQNTATEIYKRKVNYEGGELLSQAKAVWAQNPNKENAENALNIASQIEPDSKYYAQAQQLIQSINARVKAVDDREWASEEKHRQSEQALEKQRVKAIRDVAVAYARNQPKVVYHYHWW